MKKKRNKFTKFFIFVSTFQGLEALTAEDIADNILYVANAPERVQIAEIVVFPTNQASVYHIHRE
jgi:3-hydroxy acid dehydrogenase / malonic semialdehyde reductase